MSNFIHTAGTNGFATSSPVAINSSTELSALTNGSLVKVATAFNQSSYNNAQYGFIELQIVSAGWAVSAAGCISGWFLHSRDGGTNYEAYNSAAPARPPDFTIPLQNLTPAAGYYYSQLVPLPYDTHEYLLQNNTGATTSTHNHVISVLPVEDTFG
jgi:hypothetical protein